MRRLNKHKKINLTSKYYRPADTYKYFGYDYKINRKCVYIAFVAVISLMFSLNFVFLRRFATVMTTTIPDNPFPRDVYLPIPLDNTHTTPKTSSQSEGEGRNLTVVVHLEGGLGNHLLKFAMGVMVQSMARQHGFNPSLHIMSQFEDINGWGFYSDESRNFFRRKSKSCFPKLRNLMFLEGNEENFKEYTRKHDQVLGPELSGRLHIGKDVCRRQFCLVAPIEEALNTAKEVWDRGESNLQSGHWNSKYKNDTILGPYSFPMISVDQFPDWYMLGRFYDDIVDFFQVDEACYKARAHPDEVVYYYRNMVEYKSDYRPWYDNMSQDSIAKNLLGHLKGGEKLAIVTAKRAAVKPLIREMRRRNVTVRVITNKKENFLDDFFFLLSAQRELIGRGESSFFQWAALLNRNVEKTKLYFVDNGSKLKHRFLPADFPPIMENSELRKRFQFELYNI